MKKTVVLLLCAVLSLALCFANGSREETAGTKVLKLATDAALDYPTTKALAKFADLVKEKTDGRYSVEIYPSMLLGDEVSYLEQLQLGTVDIAKVSIGTISGLYQDLQVFSLPFMFKNGDEMWKVLESSVGEKVLNGLDAYGIHGIGFTDNGSRNFYTTKPITTLEDFKGMTLRVQQNNMMIGMVQYLGANAVNVSANEVYSAIQTGVCMGGENNVNIILSESYYEVAKYVTLDSHTTGMDIICINLDLWKSLSAEDQAAFSAAMDEATAYDREIWDDAVLESISTLTEKGAVVYTPTDDVLASFKKAMEPLYEEYMGKYGTWINEINEVLSK